MRKNSEKNTKGANSSVVVALNSYVNVGNFFAARRAAKNILQNVAASEDDKRHAHLVLHVTSPDPRALLVGVLSLVFSVSIAVIAAY